MDIMMEVLAFIYVIIGVHAMILLPMMVLESICKLLGLKTLKNVFDELGTALAEGMWLWMCAWVFMGLIYLIIR